MNTIAIAPRNPQSTSPTPAPEAQAVVVSESQSAPPEKKRRAIRKVEKLPQRAIKSDTVFGTLRYAASVMEGGREAMLDYIRAAANLGSEVCHEFMVKFESLSLSDQENCSLDDVAMSMELSVPNIVGTVVSVMTKLAHDQANLIAAMNKPGVVDALARAASGVGDGAATDRKTFLTMTGLLPTKHGPSVSVKVQQNNNTSVPSTYESHINRNARILQPEPEE